MQLHPVPLAEAYVSPAGSVSTSAIAPVVGMLPLFPAISVYVPVWPTVKLPVCDLLSVSATLPAIVVGSFAVAPAVAPPPLTVAVLTTVFGAGPPTLTVSAIGFPAALAAIGVVDVQVTICPAAPHVQPVPTAET